MSLIALSIISNLQEFTDTLQSTSPNKRLDSVIKTAIKVSKVGEAPTSAAANGLWSCQLNAGISTAVPVGIYARGGEILVSFLYGRCNL